MLTGVAGAALALVACGGPAYPVATQVASQAPTTAGRKEQNGPTYIGYVPYWDQANAFATVQQHPGVFDQVSPVWYSLDGNARVISADDQHADIDKAMVTSLRGKGKKVIPTITSLRNGDWQPQLVRSMLSSPGAMDTHVAAIRDLAVGSGYDGIDIDYEDLTADDRDNYSTFLQRLAGALHKEGKLLTSSVYPKDSEPGQNPHNMAQNYAAIGAACDQVRVMTFDYSYETSKAGPVSPLDWVDRMIAWAVTQVPAKKVILGVVLLGYDWPVDGRGVSVTHEQAAKLAKDNGTPIAHQDPGRSPNFGYVDPGGTKHDVWFEDATSTAPKLALIDHYGLGGALFWRLGGEDPQTWTLPALSGHRAR